jgi:hypothetical protein
MAGSALERREGDPSTGALRAAEARAASAMERASLRALARTSAPTGDVTRSTIASAFSFDGRFLASTHGDHSVKARPIEPLVLP